MSPFSRQEARELPISSWLEGALEEVLHPSLDSRHPAPAAVLVTTLGTGTGKGVSITRLLGWETFGHLGLQERFSQVQDWFLWGPAGRWPGQQGMSADKVNPLDKPGQKLSPLRTPGTWFSTFFSAPLFQAAQPVGHHLSKYDIIPKALGVTTRGHVYSGFTGNKNKQLETFLWCHFLSKFHLLLSRYSRG